MRLVEEEEEEEEVEEDNDDDDDDDDDEGVFSVELTIMNKTMMTRTTTNTITAREREELPFIFFCVIIIINIKKTIPKPKGIIIDWKSLNTQTREKIVPFFEKNNYIILKSDKLKKELRNEIIIKE